MLRKLPLSLSAFLIYEMETLPNLRELLESLECPVVNASTSHSSLHSKRNNISSDRVKLWLSLYNLRDTIPRVAFRYGVPSNLSVISELRSGKDLWV